MVCFEGTWKIQEHKVKNGPIIVDEGASAEINIDKIGDRLYKVHIPLKNGKSLDFEVPPENDQTLSYRGAHNGYNYGVRLVFDCTTNPQRILDGPERSRIERWRIPVVQPDDMGTITGTKG